MDRGTKKEIAQSIMNDLNNFLDELRVSGYKIGMDTSLKIHVLLLRLSERGAIPNDPNKLYMYLAPLICTSDREQADLKKRFDQTFYTAPVQKISPDVQKNRLYAWMLVAIFIMALCMGVRLTFFDQKPPKTVGQGKSIPQQKIPSDQNTGNTFKRVTEVTIIEQSKPFSTLDIWKYVPIMAMLLLMCAAWFVFWWWRAKQFISRVPSRAEVSEQHLYVEPNHLFHSLIMVRTARKFRRHIQQASHRLDADATVTETCRNAGYFSPMYGIINRLPQYLVLIDRTIYDDHQARWMDAFLDRLIANDVYVKRFYFSGTPHVFYPQIETNKNDHAKNSPAQSISLETLASRYANHRLIVFTDAEYFVNAISGKMPAWIRKFDQWPVRALLIPGSEQEIHFRRQTLAQSDFIVMPATERGLSALVEKFQNLSPQNNVVNHNDPGYPGILHSHTGQWLDRNAPPESTIEQLISALRTYMDAQALEWLAACAVFPSLNHSLTVLLGETLNVLTESRLLKLSRLPWFRFNTIPDWLRHRLLLLLSSDKEQMIREVITEKLEQSIHASQKEHPITFSRYRFGFAKRWYRSILRILRRQSSADSPLHDRIFFDFMYQRLSFRLSKKLCQVLGPGWTLRRILGKTFQVIVFAGILLTGVYFMTQEPAPKHSEQFSNSLGMTFVHVKAGTFEMGSPEDEKGRYNDETLHTVTLTRDFYMQTT
ncbi:conserved hypothetical protein, membrane, partial [Candidatus Magnetomorum sp. HK-1]